MKQNRLRSPIVWITTITNVGTIAKILADNPDINAWVKIGIILVGLAVEFGILNNPTSKDRV